ncbi:MAG: hypothetical protein SGI87_09715 [Flavobacteriales bacterium]|nr:hypothetical protein [Flavobacteriales bacterium]
MVNAVIVAVIGQWSETELYYYRYINPNEAIEKLHPSFADECSIISLRFENPARILQKLPECVMRDKRYLHFIADPNADSELKKAPNISRRIMSSHDLGQCW